MKKVPSALKWLAEKRGRVAYELQQTAAIAEQVQAKLESLKLDLTSLDRVIQVYDSAIEPTSIEPVGAWKGRYGPRGALRESLIRFLQAYSPEWVHTDNIETLVSMDLGLVFATSGERKRWYDNSFRRCLKKLVEDGLVERRHDSLDHGSEVGAWRWRQERTATLAEIREAGSRVE